MKRVIYGGMILALLSLLTLEPVRGQQFSGVTGVVFDKTGAAIVGVDVALDNDKISVHLKTTTNNQGEYEFLRVPPSDSYKLTFSKEGFRKLEINDVALTVATTSTRNATLEVGVVTESVEVTAASTETLNTTDASIGNVLNVQTLRDLPSLIRETPASLLGLQAGVVANSGGSANQAGTVTGREPTKATLRSTVLT
jgi:hypothetical protein